MSSKDKKRVILGMSAGVDSSSAAVLLKKQGYDVIGVFMHFWKEPSQDVFRENKCCSIESQQDARKIAQILGIPLYTVNVAREFKKEVVNYFLKETKDRKTPNPCVVCNEKIKFNFLFKKMIEMKADYVATGHYAEIKKIKGKYHLYIPLDKEKDQTYFLYSLTQKKLKHILFPVGKYKKSKIRKIAEEADLPVFNKDDSQGICFISEKSPANFIKRNISLSPGDIVLTNGKKIGKHEGLELYTIGQRKGIKIGGTGPYYVIGRNFLKKQLIVTDKKSDLGINNKSMMVEIKNWIIPQPKFPLKISVKIRYRHPLVHGIIKKVKNNLYEIQFKKPQKAITPGQSAVFYADDKEVLGGGIII